MREQPLRLGKSGTLVGILTEPEDPKRNGGLPAVILLNAGLVHRVGPNRLYVRLARNLAGVGFVVLRFDFSGVGDSRARGDHLPFRESSILETQEAMDYLQESRGSRKFLLGGICSGAAASFRTACSDRRVVGAVLINPRAHLHHTADQELSSNLRNRVLVRHYWRIAMFSSFRRRNALRMLGGSVDVQKALSAMIGAPFRRLATLGRRPSLTNDRSDRIPQLAEQGTRLLHLYSEGDEGLDYLHVVLGDRMQDWLARGSLELEILRGANHSFTLLWSQQVLLKLVQEWIWEVGNRSAGESAS